jgi:predicted dehydrogenase
MTGASFGWAVLGPGGIAHRFAAAVAGLPGMHLAAVCGRSAERAQAFAAAWAHAALGGEQPQVFADLEALLTCPGVDGLYIATPHSEHFAAALAALQAGKPVLCEKPLVPTARQAQRLVDTSRERRVFLMEAVWSRYLPTYDVVAGWLREGAIGALRGMQSSFCFPLAFDPAHRCFDPALAGGALLDIGIYNLSVTRWMLAQSLGHCPEPEALHARAVIGPTGVDHRLQAQLDFADGITSQFVCGFDGRADNAFRIDGERGTILLHGPFWEATRATLWRDGDVQEQVDRPFAINGFEHEVAAAVRAIRGGAIEEPAMPHEETLATLRWMDRIRAQVGVRYPFDEDA